MIPIQLSLSGFLSYRDRVDLDFSSFDLACISGMNGAGKSSLLDAITWSLFGQARKRDDSLINTSCEAAEVIFTFAYEGNVYRVQRANARGKTSTLELNILQMDTDFSQINLQSIRSPSGEWKPLTERTLRQTQARIEETLRMDYETFVNASFFLQGKADQFTQQRPADRKRILSSILGLEIWESYRRQAVERRTAIQFDITSLDARLADINEELSEERNRKARLKELQVELERLSKLRESGETSLENIRKVITTLEEQRKLVDTLARQLDVATRAIEDLEARFESRQQERDSYQNVIDRKLEIEAAYQDWQQARLDIEHWEEIAGQFREHEKRRQGPLDEINAARLSLEHEAQTLRAKGEEVRAQVSLVSELEEQLQSAQVDLSQAKELLDQRGELEAELLTAQQRQAEAKAENPRLRDEMEDLKHRIDQLESTEGGECPVCGGPLNPEDRLKLIEDLNIQGKDLGDKYRANQALLAESGELVKGLEAQIGKLSQVDSEVLAKTRIVDQYYARLEQIGKLRSDWELQAAPRLAEIDDQLEKENFTPEAQKRLAEIDADLKEIGYDAAAHDAARKAEMEKRAAEDELRDLEKAQAALAPIEREMKDLESQIKTQKEALAAQQSEYSQAAVALSSAEAQAPDLRLAEKELMAAKEQENRLRMEVGAAQQKVEVLKDLKARRKALESERVELSAKVGQYKQLERAFGKDGVPALLIEQALPQIEAKANELLDRLSDGNMSVRFITQAAYKDKRREDLRETLDIQISDSSGTRDYEMFSGGESFRVNFAIRLALSEVLAQRAGARLQTLVIDEGFGSQDTLGRQRLVEAINLIRKDFAKILVITHIDELKEVFPTRIEVQKTSEGSKLSLVQV